MDRRKTIWKYPLGQNINRVVEAKVVAGWNILCARIQGPNINIWGTCSRNVDAHKTIRIAIVGTGRDMPDPIMEWKYINTVETPMMEIYHIFIDTYVKLEQDGES